jgi:para-nitrobenzyl esterase
MARLLAALALAVGAVACSGGGGGGGSGAARGEEPATETPADPLAIGAVACSGGGGGSGAARDQEPAAETPADPLEIRTELGTVRGTDSAVDGVRAFLTVPFAAPPSGENRWRPPQPREPYDGPLDATAPGAACPQDPNSALARFTPIPPADEDCLTLNVWAPSDARDLPVMFWIHGGGFTAGSAHQAYYIGDDLASEGVVVVSANYRLGAFGFLATDELAGESDDGSFGNYGLADQQAALEWVQENVAAFGGDPDDVTIFGESAGGGSVCGHLASPLSEGLFHRAIVQSGGGCGDLADPEEAQASGAELLESVGCADMACLREVPTEQLLTAFSPGLSFVADGVRLSESGRDRAAAGDLEGIEVMTGSNAEEHTLFSIGMQEPTDAALRDLFAQSSDDPDALLALYPRDQFESNLDRFRTMQTDLRFACPTLAFAEESETDTYLYNFLYASPSDPFGFGPTHGAELVPLFAHPEGIAGLPPEMPADDAAVSAEMQAAWVAFATEGVPGDDTVWRPYQETNQVTLIDAPFGLADEFRGGRCDELADLTTAPW